MVAHGALLRLGAVLFKEQQCFRNAQGQLSGVGREVLCSPGPCQVGDRLVVTISSPVGSIALCSARAGEPAKAVAFCLSGFLLVLKNPSGVSRVLYFLEMCCFIKISSFSANK